MAAIREAIDDPSARTQGNAIRILSRAEARDLEPDLRRVLEDDEREAVVRRKASIAAADFGYHDLLELIVRRGSQPADQSEAQDASIAAMQLVRDEKLVDVATQLLENRHTHSIVISRVENRLSSRDLVTFLRDYAVSDENPTSYEKDLLVKAVRAQDETWDASVIQDVAFVATLWERADEEVLELLSQDEEAALAGIAQAMSSEGARWSEVMHLIDLFSPEQLAAVGLDERLVEMRQHRLEGPQSRDPGAAS